MKMTDLRAKARAIFGPAIAEPMPNQPNGAKALQERANARPIPTYKVGGAVKKTPPQPTPAERAESRKRREEYAKMKPTKEQAATIKRANRAADIEGGRYKCGGAIKKATGGVAKKPAATSGPPAPTPMAPDRKIPLKMQLPAKEPTAPTMAAKTPAAPPKPIKRAAGGAAKVRKGMMTPEGKITHAMNKVRGK